MPSLLTWYVYILRCADGTYYTGITRDLQQRLRQHNGSPQGAKYTRSRRPVKIVYQRRCRGRSSAQRIEASIKHLDRRGKIALIRSALK